MILTDRQRQIVDAEGNFLLLACPGSGKTRAAAERVARLTAAKRVKVAVCSYTNVGAERIGSVLAHDLGIVLDRQHFLGTIHGFLLRYVVYPYAHLLGAQKGPFVREGGSWPDLAVHGDVRQRMTLDCFRSTPDGSLVIATKPRSVSGTPDEILASVGERVLARKRGLFQQAGVLTADDAMSVALQILRDFPVVAEAVAGRFDELLLDEAQDTSELQLACLEVLHTTGRLQSLVLVGDLEQSIFSFQGASAARCGELAGECGLRTEALTENHRCSQKICDVAINFCARNVPDTAVGPDAGCDIDPEILLYPTDDPAAAMSIFREQLDRHGIAATDATVLARGWKLVDALNGQTSMFRDDDRRYRVGQVAARLAAGTLTSRDVRAMQRLLAYCAWDKQHLDEVEDAQIQLLRRSTYQFLGDLPRLEGDLQHWIRQVAQLLHREASSLSHEVAHTGGRTLPAGSPLKEHDAAEVFTVAPSDLRARTVHSFKGEDADAVMVVIRRPHASDPTSQLELWEAAVAGADIDPEKEEERRVLFVALTRARRYCLVALPDNPRGRAVAEACVDLGFATVPSGD